MTTLYIVRHGETTDNVEKIMQGQQHGTLTPAGIAQIEELAVSLSDTHFDAIVSSDLRRAYDSAQILARHLHLPVLTTTLLRERDWGDFTGLYIPDIKCMPLPDNVEKMNALLQRATSFLDWVKASYPDQTVLAVGHGIINKAIQAVHYRMLTRDIPKMMNAEYRILCLGKECRV
ncbi:MAG: histidine phosphatase family protein [Bacteroidaceae bacterium]|nr:histidine phosphatase family protein [Bacteroidaceae bacterium]